MTTAASYARYSSDRQKATSIDDQHAANAARARVEGWPLEHYYSDGAQSGQLPFAQRAGASAMLADAFAGRWEVLLIEGLDRPFRDMIEQETIIRRLEAAGIRIIGLCDGYDSASKSSKMHRGIRGLFNENYIDDLRDKTHRGLSGQFDRGHFAGGISYGYLSVEVDGGHRLEIDPERARTVVWIFEQYAAGRSHKAIAHELNAQGIPSPRGTSWTVSAIYGSPSKGTGILNNELYNGEYIWNRSRWQYDYDTRKRRRIERPESEWKRRQVPELRIVPPELWQQVKQRQRAKAAKRSKGGRPPRTLFGGLFKCHQCGGPVTVIDAYKYGCMNRKNRGTCDATFRISRKTMDARLLQLLRAELYSPRAIARLRSKVREALKRYKNDDRLAADRRELKRVQSEVNRLTDAVARSGWSQALSDRLAAAEQRQATLEEEIRQHAVNRIPDIMPDLTQRLKRHLEQFEVNINNDRDKAREAIRQAIPGGTVTEEADGTVYVDLELNCAHLAATGTSQITMVAGAGFCRNLRRVVLVSGTRGGPELRLVHGGG